jgi:hypothetical protein
MRFASRPFDRGVRDAEIDTLSIRIDVGDVVKGNGRVAIPEEHAPPDHDLVGMVHVALVAHVVERAQVAAIECDDAKTLRIR